MNTQAAPGWYPDPEVPGQQRYWDGSAWQQAAPLAGPGWPQAAAGRPREVSPVSRRAPIVAWAGLSLLLLIVGSIGPWIVAHGPLFDLSANGTDKDGVVLIGLAVLTIPLLAGYALASSLKLARLISLGCACFFALLATILSIIDWADVNGEDGGVLDVSVGWGLWLAVAAAISLLVSLIVAFAVRRFR